MRSPKFTSIESEGFCGLHHGTFDGKNKEVAEMAKKVIKKLKEEERAEIVCDRMWEGRKEQDDCVVWLPGE